MKTMEMIDDVALFTRAFIQVADFGKHKPYTCVQHALAAQYYLRRRYGVDSKVVAGDAGWQLGRGPNDSVGHGEDFNSGSDGKNTFVGHAWLQLAGMNFDPTGYLLYEKAAYYDNSPYPIKVTVKVPNYYWFGKSVQYDKFIKRAKKGDFTYRVCAQRTKFVHDNPGEFMNEKNTSLLVAVVEIL